MDAVEPVPACALRLFDRGAVCRDPAVRIAMNDPTPGAALFRFQLPALPQRTAARAAMPNWTAGNH